MSRRAKLAALGGGLALLFIAVAVITAVVANREDKKRPEEHPAAAESDETATGPMAAKAGETATDPTAAPLPPDAAGETGRDGSTDRTADMVPVAPGKSSETKRKRITVRLPGLPRGAAVRLDGKVVRPPLRLRATGRRHKLEIRARGYKPLIRTFVAAEHTRVVKIEMTRKSGKAARRRRRRPSTRRPGPSRTKSGVYHPPWESR